MDGVPYSWDAKGNLLDDGTRTYTYNHANRLTAVVMGTDSFTYAYNGLGDRIQQTINSAPQKYTLDLIGGLTQVLFDEMDAYLYGVGRIGQEQHGEWQYYIGDALDSVRQITGASAGPTFTHSFESFGSSQSYAGINPSKYGFIGEWTDTTGLIHLRARYYYSEIGRFISKDPWMGYRIRSLSQNNWIYSEGNPVSFVDRNGLWRWALTSSIYHMLVENHYEGTPGGLLKPNKQLEYRIPGTRRRPDMFNSLTGDVFEVEPWFLANSSRHGTSQALSYVNELMIAAAAGSLEGEYLFGIPYNWNSAPFHLGIRGDWPGKFSSILPTFPLVDLVADYASPGLILYWIEPNEWGLAAIAASLPLIVPNKRLLRPQGWSPGDLALQPANVLLWSEACGYALIIIGGVVIVVTLAEDIGTLGVGVFDDLITIPGGILLINWGQQLGAQVPVIVR